MLLAFETASTAQNGATLEERLSSTEAHTRATAIRILGEEKASLKWLGALQGSLKDGHRSVVLEGLKAWEKVGNGYDRELTFLAYEDGGDSARFIPNGDLQAWQRKLVNSLSNIAERGDVLLRRQALRTMCKLCLGADTICPPARLCGTGEDQTLWFKISTALAVLAKTHRADFLALLHDGDPDVVYNCLCCLPGQRWQAFGNLAMTYLSNPDKRFRAIGMWIASASPFQVQLDLIGPSLDDEDEDVRLTAEAFLQLPEEEAMRIALDGTMRSENLRVLAIQNSASEQSPQRDAALRRLLTDPEPKVRSAALEKLGDDGQTKDFAMVQEGLDDPSPLVRATALTLGAQCEMPGLLPFIKAGLTSESRRLRDAAIWSTMRVEGSNELTPEMVRAVDMGVGDTWMASPDFDDPRFGHLVNECLESKNPEVRKLLCFHFSVRCKGPKPVDIMIRLARDPDPDVARLMVYDLSSLNDPEAFETIVDLTASKFLIVRTSAVAALADTKRSGAIPILRRAKIYLTDHVRGILYA